MAKLEPFVKRVHDEFIALSEKISALDTFIDSPGFEEATEVQQGLMVDQLASMNAYKTILWQRYEDLELQFPATEDEENGEEVQN